MAAKIYFNRGLETNRSGVTPASGEPLWTTDGKVLFIGDGSTAGGLPVASASTYSSSVAYVAESVPGVLPTATGSDALAAGDGAVASGVDTIAFGRNANSSITSAVAIGSGAQGARAYQTGSVAIGVSAHVDAMASYEAYGVAIGAGAAVGSLGHGALSMGYLADSDGYGSVAIGLSSLSVLDGAIAIGSTAHANNVYAVAIGDTSISGGVFSFALGPFSYAGGTGAVSVGPFARAYGEYSFAMGGGATIAGAASAQSNSSIAMGGAAIANNVGEFAFASGVEAFFAKRSEYVCVGATTNATPKILSPDNSGVNRITIPASTAHAFEARIVAYQTSTNDTKVWRYVGCIKRDGSNNTAFVGTPTEEIIAEDTGAAAWTINLTANNTVEALQFQAVGEAAKSITWNAHVVMNGAQ